MTYDAASQLKGINRYADLAGTQLVAESSYDYDVASRLKELKHFKGTDVLAAYGFDYDAGNRITSFSSPDGTSTYSYDLTNQLTGTDHSYQDDENYSYDDNGNRTNDGYDTGTDNRLLTDGKYNYSYDDEGNRTQRVEIATGEVTEYSWDYRNRLTEVVVKDTNGNVIKTAGYAYDMFDRRIAKEVDPDGDGVATASVERFVYDGEHIALTFDGDGTQTHRYLHGPMIDQVLASENAQGEVLWALTDNQGTVRDIVDNNGTVVNHITYDSFGQVTGESNSNVDFRFGYTGREFDEETGQYYYRARYYDAATGQFISQDPIGFEAGDPNFYRYVNNSPANFTDPTGEILDALYKNDTLYNVANKLDQFSAGASDATTFGFTTWLRERMYGETATRNHSGGLFTAGQIFGTAASTAVGFGAGGNAARGGGWAIRTAKVYNAVGDITGVYQSTSKLLEGCFTPIDALGFAPVAGYLGGRALSRLKTTDNLLTNSRFGRKVKTALKNCSSFVAGTEILTAEGIKDIEDIKVGDWVIADDPTTPGEIEKRQVLNTFSQEADVIVDLYVDGEIISTTEEHPFWTPDKGWVEAQDLEVGDLLQTDEETYVDVDRIEQREGKTKVYNFEVEGFSTYFVSDLGILVHNAECNLSQVPITGNSSKKLPIISAVSEDWAQKGAHIKIDGIEIAARPGQDGTIVFKPVFSSTSPKDIKTATKAAEDAIQDLGFRQRLYNASIRAINMLQQGDNMSRSRAGELRFLTRSLEKMGI